MEAALKLIRSKLAYCTLTYTCAYEPQSHVTSSCQIQSCNKYQPNLHCLPTSQPAPPPFFMQLCSFKKLIMHSFCKRVDSLKMEETKKIPLSYKVTDNNQNIREVLRQWSQRDINLFTFDFFTFKQIYTVKGSILVTRYGANYHKFFHVCRQLAHNEFDCIQVHAHCCVCQCQWQVLQYILGIRHW